MIDEQPPIGDAIKKEVMIAKLIKGMTYSEIMAFAQYFPDTNEISIDRAADNILTANEIEL